MNGKPIVVTLLIVLIAYVLIGMALPFYRQPKMGRPSWVQIEIINLKNSMKGFQLEFGYLPTGDNSNIVKTLAGDNPGKIAFLAFHRFEENPNEMLDPWKTPYRFQFFQVTNYLIQSAGADKIFGTKDDVKFNSVTNDFIKP